MRAVAEMASEGLMIRAISRFYKTPCFPVGAGPDYVNAAVSVATREQPQQVLETLHSIETRMGRMRETRWGMRTLDLDLIAADASVLPDAKTVLAWNNLDIDQQTLRAPDELIIPHPRLADRAFVLVPLMDIVPDWRHPLSGLSIGEMLQGLPQEDKQSVCPI